MKATDLFSPDYATARDRFRDAAARLGWRLEAHAVDSELTVDVALSAGGHADTLVISSGLHGVEGFFGSAVQLGLMEQWMNKTPPINFVFIHALNPFGFAHQRRSDQDNIDLNRNFLLTDEPFAGSPDGYAALNDLLNPPRPPSRWDFFLPKALLAIVRSGGLAKLKQAVAGGQYAYPQGLFFGGSQPSATRRILEENLRRWIGGSSRVVHLDFHTGLGERGLWKLLIDHPLTDPQRQRLREWFGAESFEESNTRGVAYQARGSIGRWCVETNRQTDYLYACAEFGTYGPIKVLAALRAENQAHHWGNADDLLHAKRKIMEAFCPASETWRDRVVRESLRLVASAINGLAGRSSAP